MTCQGDNPEGATDGNYYYNSFLLRARDANFDGKVDINDLTIVLGTTARSADVGPRASSPVTARLTSTTSPLCWPTTAAAMVLPATLWLVPEPSALAIAAIGCWACWPTRGRSGHRPQNRTHPKPVEK